MLKSCIAGLMESRGIDKSQIGLLDSARRASNTIYMERRKTENNELRYWVEKGQKATAELNKLSEEIQAHRAHLNELIAQIDSEINGKKESSNA